LVNFPKFPLRKLPLNFGAISFPKGFEDFPFSSPGRLFLKALSKELLGKTGLG